MVGANVLGTVMNIVRAGKGGYYGYGGYGYSSEYCAASGARSKQRRLQLRLQDKILLLGWLTTLRGMSRNRGLIFQIL